MTYQLNNKTDLRELRKRLEQVVDEFAGENDLQINLGTFRFKQDGSSMTSKMTVEPAGQEPAEVRELKGLLESNSLWGLVKSDLDVEFEVGGKKFKIYGYNSRARKRPLIVQELSTGKTMRGSVDIIRNALVKVRGTALLEPDGKGGLVERPAPVSLS